MAEGFVKISHKDIYNMIKSIREEDLKEIKEKIHLLNEQVKVTNGKVKLAHWIATTALSIAVAIIIGLLGVGKYA